jgi:hypothetical protein
MGWRCGRWHIKSINVGASSCPPPPCSSIPPLPLIPSIPHSCLPGPRSRVSVSFMFWWMAPVSYHVSFWFSDSFFLLSHARYVILFSIPILLAYINLLYLFLLVPQSWNRLDFQFPSSRVRPHRRLRPSAFLLLLLPRRVDRCRASILPHSRSYKSDPGPSINLPSILGLGPHLPSHPDRYGI